MRRAALPSLLFLGSVALYFLLLQGFGVYQRYPWPHIAACSAGSIWLAAQFARERTWGRAAITLSAITFTATYVWYAFDYTTYPPRAQKIVEGQVIAELATLELADHEGIERIVIDPEDSRATLLILYRGYW